MPALEWEVTVPQATTKNRVTVGAFAAVAAVLGFQLTANLLASVFAAGAILGTSLELWFPLKYRIDEQKARAKCWFTAAEISWSNVLRVQDDGDNVLLSPFASPSRLDRFRGVKLRFASNREEVLAKIAGLRRKDERTLEGGADAGSSRSDDREDRDAGA